MSHPQQPHVDQDRKEILESRIGLALLDIAPPGWYLIDLRGSMTVDTQQLELVAVMQDGSEAATAELPENVHRQIIEAMTELRRMMYRPDAGTWFSMRLAANADSYSVAYDYYHEPPWDPPLDPDMYLRDYEAFPRAPMHLPEWLWARLRQVEPERFSGSFEVVGPMSPERQRDWADEAAALLGQTLPPGNKQTTIYYRALGGHVDLSVGFLNVRMVERPWDPPAKLIEMLGELREGMYGKLAGTWFTLRLQVHHLSSLGLDYNWTDEPDWKVPPPESAYREELEMFPRAPEATPYWLAQRAGLAAGPELRVARPYDATLPFPGYPSGYPTFTDRPTVSDEERDRLSAYLETAPVVVSQDGRPVPDLFDQTGTATIPREYRTDGTWVWPAAVAYYLREHKVAPERDLVEHIRARDYRVPDVDQRTRDAATAAVQAGPTGGSIR